MSEAVTDQTVVPLISAAAQAAREAEAAESDHAQSALEQGSACGRSGGIGVSSGSKIPGRGSGRNSNCPRQPRRSGSGSGISRSAKPDGRRFGQAIFMPYRTMNMPSTRLAT